MGSSCLTNTHKLYLFPLSNANNPLVPCQSRFPCNMNVAKVRNSGLIEVVNNRYHGSCLLHKPKDNNGLGSVVRCASWSTVTALERELETEMNTKDQSIGMARFRHKCGEGKSVVEMLECLEREAIMGDDVGKEPVDYNRRAQIFDRSSRVFQALKELNSKSEVISLH
ncbi:hypothetical protein RJT34_00933 [Clitoria ternatea]|uniref:Uncharacterized protein n=1 Tax=Clitoria ternatea TaxID=43366 RepID=A0AAN9KFS1_CLITE